MNGTKNPLFSTGLWGAVITAAFLVMEALGVSLPFTAIEAQETVYKVIEVAGTVLAFVGRWNAKSEISVGSEPAA